MAASGVYHQRSPICFRLERLNNDTDVTVTGKVIFKRASERWDPDDKNSVPLELDENNFRFVQKV